MSNLPNKSPYTIINEDVIGRKELVNLYENDIVSVDAGPTKAYYGVVRFGEYATVGEVEPYNYGWYIDWDDSRVNNPA